MAGMLYLVPTPIGNLGDISDRCRRTLEEADFIAAEDTRVSLKLLNHLGIRKSLVSYYEHNKTFKGQAIVDRILAGETCALVSDAGSPAISDPGEDLVKQCAEAGITVCAIPGPCAVITALSISGQATGRFCFEGFLSTAKKSRQAHLDSLRKEQRTMIFYEAPHKLVNTLQDLAGAFGSDRPISLCRELTKLHEEVVRTTLPGKPSLAGACWAQTEDPSGCGAASPSQGRWDPDSLRSSGRPSHRLGMQPWALSLPDKELCLREALAVCTPPVPEPSAKRPGS